MKAFQERVIAEQDELVRRIVDLECFVSGQQFLALSSEERARMTRQLAAMRTYSEVLGERIVNFD